MLQVTTMSITTSVSPLPGAWVSKRVGFLATVLVASIAPGLAAAGPADDLRDVQTAILARQALQDDPLLAPHNLGVRVRDGVAVLWGPVPSKELAERATARLRKLPQLRGVRNELFLDPWGDLPVAITTPVRPPVQPPETILTAKPAQPPPAKPAPPWMPVNQGAAKPPPPVQAKTPSVQFQEPKAPAPSDSPADILAAVRRLQRGEDRFRRVTVTVHDGTVYLGGVIYRWADIHELSRAVARVPGVDHVVLRGVRSER